MPLRIIQVEDCQLCWDRLVLRYYLNRRTRKWLRLRRKGCTTTAVRLVTTLRRLIPLIDNGGHLMKKLLITASIVK
jgi:hypothetical protein